VKKLTEMLNVVTVVDTDYDVQSLVNPKEVDNTYGTVDVAGGLIEINDDIVPTLALRVLWHELFHIDQANRGKTDFDEDFPNTTSLFVNQILLDNPQLIAIYTKIHKGKL
jgi:hypothetical protein